MAHIISITDFDTPELDVYARSDGKPARSTGQTPQTPSLSQKRPLVIGRALESRLRAGVLSHGATAP